MSKYNIKSIKEEFKNKGIFYTTSELAELLKSYIDIEFDEVYDPTCGDGQLLSVFDDNIKKYGQEINDHQLQEAEKRLVNFKGVCGDTLKAPAFADKKFKCIVANPPFSISWEPPEFNTIFADERFVDAPAIPPKSKADYAFILHILHYLENDGIAIVLNFPGILYRGNTEGKIRKYIIEKNYIDKIIRIPGKTFIDTTIETTLIIFRKNKNHTNIEFKDGDKVCIATLEEIQKNDYTLSINNYIKDDAVKIIYNPKELQENARTNKINGLMQDLRIDKQICELEGWDFQEYLTELKKAIDNFIE